MSPRPNHLLPIRNVLPRGFTIIELITALAFLALAVALALPKFTSLRESSQLGSAKEQLSSYIATARFAAIRRGSTAQVRRSGNQVSVTVSEGGVQEILRRAVDLDATYGVSISSAPDSIVFDPRGFVTGSSATAKFIFAKGTRRDSLCVTPMGYNSPSAMACSL
jgi:prepilin-type N-terminal cleavage/methylation domain-containing protein